MTKTLRGLVALTITGAASAALVACSAIGAGTITAKVHEPANTYVTTSCVIVGKVPVCTPHTIIDDEDWRLDLREGDETGYVYVDAETFDAVEVGDYYEEAPK